MILDSSAIVAVIRQEAEAVTFGRRITIESAVKVSAATVLESHLVIGLDRRAELDAFLDDARAQIMPVDVDQVRLARDAHDTYGRGSGSKAQLNFGDCFSYALAKSTGEPLLFKGDGFRHTDITSAT